MDSIKQWAQSVLVIGTQEDTISSTELYSSFAKYCDINSLCYPDFQGFLSAFIRIKDSIGLCEVRRVKVRKKNKFSFVKLKKNAEESSFGMNEIRPTVIVPIFQSSIGIDLQSEITKDLFKKNSKSAADNSQVSTCRKMTDNQQLQSQQGIVPSNTRSVIKFLPDFKNDFQDRNLMSENIDRYEDVFPKLEDSYELTKLTANAPDVESPYHEDNLSLNQDCVGLITNTQDHDYTHFDDSETLTSDTRLSNAESINQSLISNNAEPSGILNHESSREAISRTPEFSIDISPAPTLDETNIEEYRPFFQNTNVEYNNSGPNSLNLMDSESDKPFLNQCLPRINELSNDSKSQEMTIEFEKITQTNDCDSPNEKNDMDLDTCKPVGNCRDECKAPSLSESTNSFHKFFGKVKLASDKSKPDREPPGKEFHYRKKEKEGDGEFFSAEIFSRFKSRESMKFVSPENIKCDFQTLEEHLEFIFPSKNDSEVWKRAKSFKTSFEKKTKVFLCSAFFPIVIGTAAANFLNFTPNINYPQFSLLESNKIVVQCEICTLHNTYEISQCKSSKNKVFHLKGFTQVYQHYISSNHQKVIKWMKSNVIAHKYSPNNKSEDPNFITNYTETKAKARTQCHYVWEKAYVDAFRNDCGIRRKTPKTLYQEKKIYKLCINKDNHHKCNSYKEWKKLHHQEYENLCSIANESSRSVFVPGDHTILINGKSTCISGGIKSLDPPCQGFAGGIGDHPYTCLNCVKQIPFFKDLIKKREKSKYSSKSNRLGSPGFRSSYAQKQERIEYIKKVNETAKSLKREVYTLKKTVLSKKSWEEKLYDSCISENDQKLVLDLLSLFNNSDKKMQIEVLRNLIGKMKSGRNHRFTAIIKDVGNLHKNRLGSTNYNLLKSLFGLPSKATCDNHSKKAKITLGFNDDQIEEAVNLYNQVPVIDCTDEARTLRFISPIDDNGDVQLVGECWSPDIDEWGNCKRRIPKENASFDQFTQLKMYIDEVINEAQLAKDTAVHNLSSMFGPERKPLIYLVWPTPNKGYKGSHLLKIWDHLRLKCFTKCSGELREHPVMLLGHSSDSAAFQLAAAKTLLTPNDTLLKLGVKYLSLGVGESQYAAPYLSPLPSIAYLDFEHELRLFLKCLKYETLDMMFWTESCLVSVNHLKELQKILLDQQLSVPFLESDLLFARYLDQNCDAAVRVFTYEVADMLEKHVIGSNGTVLYLKAVILLLSAYREQSGNPNDIQFNITAGITIIRLWRKVVCHTSMLLHAGSGASMNPNKRGNFLTAGCYHTAEILFSAATNHMLAIYCHFRHLGPQASSPNGSGTRTTERIISEIQGKTNQLQCLDAQPTLGDILQRVSKVNFNQQAEERIALQGVQKPISTNRKRLSHTLIHSSVDTAYCYPETYQSFRLSQIDAYERGCEEGKNLFRKYCPDGYAFLEMRNLLETYEKSICKIPESNLFEGTLSDEYSAWVLREVKSSEILCADNDTAKHDHDEFEKEPKFGKFDEDIESICETLKKEDLSEVPSTRKWYVSRSDDNGNSSLMHISRALKLLIPREYVSRERRNRHIASNYLPGLAPINSDHDLVLNDYVYIKLASGPVLGKLMSLVINGKDVVSCSSSCTETKFRALLFDNLGTYQFQTTSPLKISKLSSMNIVICKVNIDVVDDILTVNDADRVNIDAIHKQESTVLDFKIAKSLQKSFVPLDYEQVEDITNKKIDPKTHGFMYEVKFLQSDEKIWIPAANFLYDVCYKKRQKQSQQEQSFINFAMRDIEASNKQFTVNRSKEMSFQTKLKRPKQCIPSKKANKKRKICQKSMDKLQFFKSPSLSSELSNKSDRKLNKWLNDDDIRDAIVLIRLKCPNVSGLRDTLVKKKFEFVGENSMQIHHNGAGHWLFSIELDGFVYIFDSLFSEPNKDLSEQLLKCYTHRVSNGKLLVKYPLRQKQVGSNDCGLFAIAYAVEAALNAVQLSEFLAFDQSRMRQHWNSCILNDTLKAFPKSLVSVEALAYCEITITSDVQSQPNET